MRATLADAHTAYALDYLKLDGAVNVVRAYARIADSEVRRAVVEIVAYRVGARTEIKVPLKRI